jgi:iron complex outermembrane receptor protein
MCFISDIWYRLRGADYPMRFWSRRGRSCAWFPVLVLAFPCGSLASDLEEGEPARSLEEVVVTGTLLREAESELSSPLITITKEQIRESGMTTVTDVVRALPADNSGSLPTAYTGGFAIGAAGVSLRGLTVNSTLVLVDGRRVASYALTDDGQRSFVDLNSIPLASVERIEVLQDDASAIYGADAVAGVVNVILKKQYQGLELSAEGGAGQHPGGSLRRFTAEGGVGDLSTDRYNAFVSVEFQGDDRIGALDRPYPFNTDDLSAIGGLDARRGRPGSFSGTPTAIVAPAVLQSGAASPAILNTTQVGSYQPLSACSGVGNTAATAPSAIAGATDRFCLQNHDVFFDQQAPQHRIGVTARLTAALGDSTQAYFVESYAQTYLAADFAPAPIQSGTPFNTENIALPPTLPNGALNPNDPFAAAGQYALIQYAFGDIPSQESVTNHNSRTTVGLQGRLAGWDYDTALVINHTWLDLTLRGLPSVDGLLSAVTNGTYNFVDPAANTAAGRNALAPPLMARSTSDMDSIDLRATRSAPLTLAGGPLSVGLGVEARYEALSSPALDPDNNVLDFPANAASGSRWIAAGYFEVGAPVLKSFALDASGRFDHYSDSGDAFTPKVGFKFTPVSEITLRGTYSRGFRAPSFAEGGRSVAENFVEIDPTAGIPFPASYCSATYHSTGYCSQYLVGSSTAANPSIKPERSDSFTLGAIFKREQGLSVAVDFYAIKKKNVITSPNTGPALQAYLAGAPIPAGYTVTPDQADPAFPNSLARPLLVTGLYQNQSSLRTDGMDVELQGTVDFHSWGSWSSKLSATKIFSFKLELPDGTTEQFVGTQGPYTLSSGAGTPRYRANWSNTYANGPFSATLSTYYVSRFAATAVDATGSPDVCLYSGTFCHVASFIDFDLTGIVRVNPHFAVFATVQNLMDRLPPVDPADYAGTRFNPTWHQAGIIGRYFKAGIDYRF